ncbi:MAG: hypothetical protein HUU21_34405 [Polyangiaceae bacterium]|nr:hypothetical protein [Polyangiaceae bacterium]NUQ78649.1 hypothetical protein [Polyangiaceae bacterium]
MSRRYIVSTRCECQAFLSAELDEHRHPLSGWAYRGGIKEPAPAHSINASHDRFDIGWLCNFCGRNTLRSFYAGALKPLKAPASPPPPELAPSPETPSKSA